MTRVTPDTPFRATGNTDLESFRAQLAKSQSGAPSPVAPEADAIYAALAPLGLTRLGAALAWIERSNETNPADLQYYGRELHNLFAVKNPPEEQARKGLWRRYPSYAAAAQEWGPYILGATYNDLTTIAEFIGRYAPWSDGNNPDRYGRRAAELINALPLLEEDDPVAELNWEPIPYPKMRKAIVTKPYDGAGFYRVASRRRRIVGSCNHITAGDPGGDQIEWYRRFFSTGGERQYDALTDLVIAPSGEAGILNDWRDDNWGGTRAGWANGTVEGLEGDGVNFYKWYPEINDVLVSKEHVAPSGRRLTDAAMETSIAISAAVAQESRCPWDTYPYHPGKHGVNIEMMHYLFATKPCPDFPFRDVHYPVLVREVRARLTKQQTGSTNPGDPSPPPVPGGGYPFGFDQEAMEFFFGTLTRYDGAEFGFDPTGPISLIWLARCREEGKFPEAESWSKFGDRDVVQWEGGWTLLREGAQATWSWLDKGAPSPVATPSS